MAVTDEENRGYLQNCKKEKQHEKDRDYRGKININGKLYWISGYLRPSADGGKFLKLLANEV